jgi:hypothetical protein
MSRRDIYAAATVLAAIAAVVFAAVSLSVSQLRIALAVICVVVLAWRRLERAPLLDPVQGLAVVVLVSSVAWIIVSAAGDSGEKNQSAPDPQHEATPGKVIRVYNRVTSGPRMREDDEPVSLSMKPAANCADRNCLIKGTNRETGGTYDAAVCQRQGEEITNGQDTTALDDANPELFQSRRHYGVRLDEDTFGYVSEVWIAPRDRGGLGLPIC